MRRMYHALFLITVFCALLSCSTDISDFYGKWIDDSGSIEITNDNNVKFTKSIVFEDKEEKAPPGLKYQEGNWKIYQTGDLNYYVELDGIRYNIDSNKISKFPYTSIKLISSSDKGNTYRFKRVSDFNIVAKAKRFNANTLEVYQIAVAPDGKERAIAIFNLIKNDQKLKFVPGEIKFPEGLYTKSN
jgi:hypothetical protein